MNVFMNIEGQVGILPLRKTERPCPEGAEPEMPKPKTLGALCVLCGEVSCSSPGINPQPEADLPSALRLSLRRRLEEEVGAPGLPAFRLCLPPPQNLFLPAMHF